MALKALFIGFTIASLCGSVALISLGVYEMWLDQREHVEFHEGHNIIVTHVFIALLIFFMANVLIMCHVIYITYYVLKGYRYRWLISWHYFFYVLLEIISVVCVIGKYEYLEYGLHLHILTGILAVFLFFFNCFSVQIHQELEYKIREEEEERKWQMERDAKKQKIQCIRINLKESSSNLPSTTSAASTSSNKAARIQPVASRK